MIIMPDDEEILSHFFKFTLLLHKNPRFKPRKVDDIKRSLKYIPKIKEAARNLKDNDSYFEIIIMADEVAEILNSDLNQKLPYSAD